MIISIEKSNNKQFIFHYEFDDNSFSHAMTLPSSLTPSDHALFRIALFARPADHTQYTIRNVSASNEIKHYFQDFLNATIDVSVQKSSAIESVPLTTLPQKKHLSFSGGFDSIAAQAVLGENTELISVDFGGALEREALFFKEFKTNIVQWKLRGKQSNQKIQFNESLDWRWLISPSLFLQQENEPFVLATGTIMEAGPFWFSADKRPAFTQYESCGMGLGVALINPLASLTEVTTAFIACQTLDSSQVQRSLTSLAAPDSLKALRKKALLSVALKQPLPEASKKMHVPTFGNNFADDFLALYLQWKVGADWVENNYSKSLPSHTQKLDMSFLEKYNQRNLDVFDPEFRGSLEGQFEKFGIKKYTAKDMRTLSKVKSILQYPDMPQKKPSFFEYITQPFKKT